MENMRYRTLPWTRIWKSVPTIVHCPADADKEKNAGRLESLLKCTLFLARLDS